MNKLFTNIILSIGFTLALFSFVSINPNNIFACCGGDCSGGEQCIDAPSLCPDPNTGAEGYCVSGYETCSGSANSSSCPSGECCGGNGLCTSECGSGGGGGGVERTCYPRKDCPLNSSCTPSGSYLCNTINVNYNSYVDYYIGDVPTGYEGTCPMGNAEGTVQLCSDGSCNWYDRKYDCCPAGSVSQYYYAPGSQYVRTAEWHPDAGPGPGSVNCYPGFEVQYLGQVGGCTYNGNGKLLTCTYGALCQEQDVKVNVCTNICSVTAPSTTALLSPSNNSVVSSTTISLTWNNSSQTWGNACGTQTNQYRVYVGTSPSSLGLIGTVGSGTSSTNFSGSSGQTYYWRVDATNGVQTTSSSVWQFTINSGPWWQTKDGSATTNNSLSSTVPTGSYFSIVGLGGFSGVPVYGGTFNLSSTPTLISTRSWNANTTTIQPRLFNYSYFNNLIPDDVNDNIVVATDASLRSSGYSSDGYEWFKSNGSLSIDSDIDFGNRKVIVFVENGDLNINGKINLTDGLGFVGFFIEGDMTINSSVTGTPSIEGIYEVDGNFENGTGTNQLHARGSIAVFGGVSLSRSLTNNTNPAELFEFAPDLMFNYPKALGFRRSKWQEIAP